MFQPSFVGRLFQQHRPRTDIHFANCHSATYAWDMNQKRENRLHWLRRSLLILCLSVCACQDQENALAPRQEDPWGRQPDPMLAPVEDIHAPTLKVLLSQGYVIVDQRESPDVGPRCKGDCFDALYLGKEGGPSDRTPLAEYACPGTDEHSDQWKCRTLRPPYTPNGGFKPEVR